MTDDLYRPPRPPFAESAGTGALGDPLPRCRLTITLLNGTLWHHRPLHSEIVRRARASELSGVSVFFGIEGFGAEGVIHTTRILSVSDRLPIMIVTVDGEPRIQRFVHGLDPLMEIESMIVEHVWAVRLRRPSHLPR